MGKVDSYHNGCDLFIVKWKTVEKLDVVGVNCHKNEKSVVENQKG